MPGLRSQTDLNSKPGSNFSLSSQLESLLSNLARRVLERIRQNLPTYTLSPVPGPQSVFAK